MSGKKISELQELLALENDDLLLVVDADEANIANKSKSVKISTLKAEVGSPADKANTDLSNIVEATDLVQGAPNYKLKSDITFDKGDAAVTIRGKEYTGISGEPSGELRIFSGAAADANSGGLSLNSGNIISGLGSSGDVTLKSGFLSTGVQGNSGKTTVSTGQTENGDSGNVEIITGAATGTRGGIILDASQVTVNSDIVLTSGNTSRVKNLADAADANDAVNKSQLDTKQDTLFSGTNIKTVNGTSLLGSGDLVVGGGVAESAESLITNVFNASGSPIAKMSAIYINGIQGDQPRIVLAQANSEMSSSKTYGLVQTDIPNMSAGVIIEQGRLENLDTDVVGWVEGDALWLSATVAGGITNVKPSAPNHSVFIGYLIRKHQNVGVIQVSIQNGNELQELHNVAIPVTPANGDVLAYELATSLWKNKTLTAADVGAATTSLSNLVTTAIPSGVDIISNSGAGVIFDVKTANSSTGNTGIASFGSGSSTAGSSAYAELITGTGTTGTGVAYVETGKSATALSGAIVVTTGNISSAGLINNLSNTSGTGQITISSGFSNNTSSTLPTGGIQIFSGASSGSGGSGTVSLTSGAINFGTGTSGIVTCRSGDTTIANASTGQTVLRSGNAAGVNSTGVSGSTLVRSGTTVNGNSGQVELISGAVSGTGASGQIVVRSGATNLGNSGQVEFSSGSSTSGNSGNTVINTGTAGGTRGNIYLLSPVIFTNNTSTETVVTTKNEVLAANTIDLLNMTGSVYHKNLTENTAFTFSIPSNSGKKFTIVTKNATGSSYTVNFPTVKQKAGTINNTVAANTTSIFEFLISDNEIYCISCIDNIV